MKSNSVGMTRHVYHEGTVVVCTSDHLWKDKVNYLGRYTVLSVGMADDTLRLDAHFSGQCLSILSRDNIHVVQVPVELFVPEGYFDGKEDPMSNEYEYADLIAQKQQFQNLPDGPKISEQSEIEKKLVAAGKNPKQQYGDKKPRLTLAPLSATIAQVEAQLDGKLKYGEVNWRINKVEALTYIDAAIRHLRLYENGEEYARDTGVFNLGAVMACCAILIDAGVHGTLIDNRKHSPQTCDMLHERGEVMTKLLQDLQKERDKKNVG